MCESLIYRMLIFIMSKTLVFHTDMHMHTHTVCMQQWSKQRASRLPGSYPALVPHPVLLLLEEGWTGGSPLGGAPPSVSDRAFNCNFSSTFAYRRQDKLTYSPPSPPSLFPTFTPLSSTSLRLSSSSSSSAQLTIIRAQAKIPTASLVYTFNSSSL